MSNDLNLPLPVINAIKAHRGQFHSILTRRPCEMRAAHRGTPLFKVSYLTVKLGCEYDNQAKVQEKRENGELPTENRGLVGKEFVLYPFIKRSIKSGKLMLACTPVHNDSAVHFSRFERSDGTEVGREEAMALCTAKEFPSKRDWFGAMDIMVDNIVEVDGIK